MFYLFLFLFGDAFCELDRLRGWNYINLHCRNNDNAPVDWWIIYKPPSGVGLWETGANFSYITSLSAGQWIPSERFITSNTMLQHTLAPLYRPTYSDHLAVMTYYPKQGSDTESGSVAMGVLMADELGGAWIAHTVPGLPDISRDRFRFPEDELKHGHMLICLSADFITLNEIAKALRQMEPRVLSVQVPEKVKEWLPDWLPMSDPIRVPLSTKNALSKLEFKTYDKTIRVQILVRRPGDKVCLYQTFAKSRNLLLDVYGHDQASSPACDKEYGVRKINAISLNYPNTINENSKHIQVVYVNNQTDRIEFAVSTAAHWQRKGGSLLPEYWACIGTSAGEDTGKGGLLLCIYDFDVWRSFDILKVKEPDC